MSLVKTLIFISGALEFAPFALQSQPLTQMGGGRGWEGGSDHAALHPGKHISSTWLTSFNLVEGLFFLVKTNASDFVYSLQFMPFLLK